MDEDPYSLNTENGRFNRMEAAIDRAFTRRQENALAAWEFEHVLDYRGDSQLRQVFREETQAERDYTSQKAEYTAGRIDIETMEEAGYTYSGAVNLHEQVKEQRIQSEQARQEAVERRARHEAAAGDRARAIRDTLPPSGSSRRPRELPNENPASRGRRHHGSRRSGGNSNGR
ncbi:hypothetical protein ACFC09_06245 [Streptomyces sp. NPDC056161]|uniref:hypothetical protein n=1 Tax=Streptomyces sp. NPDC056161 TaxID=3345732 RepID=UPI0035D7FBA7